MSSGSSGSRHTPHNPAHVPPGHHHHQGGGDHAPFIPGTTTPPIALRHPFLRLGLAQQQQQHQHQQLQHHAPAPFVRIAPSVPTTSRSSPSRSDSEPLVGTQPQQHPSSGRGPGHRSRNGCYTCRRRKVKCDERTPVCIKCEYSDRKCEWPPDDPIIRRKNRPRRMRLGLADEEERAITATVQATTASATPALDEGARRKMRVPLDALKAFAATLPPLSSIRGYDKTLAQSLMPTTLRASMMMDSAFLAPYFPAVDERLIFRHYISRTVHLSIAFDDPKNTWNPWLNLIAPLAFTHLPGASAAADALRTALLTIGSVHLHYIADPTDQAGASRIMNLARPKVLHLVHGALEGEKDVDKLDVELILAALLGCIIASSLASDDGWHPLLSAVISFVTKLGGSQSLLQDAPRDHLSTSRFVLEQLAIREVFGCMTTEMAPTILRDAFTPWFFEAESWSRTDQEWESVERMFGISRGMVDLIARTCGLVANVRQVATDDETDTTDVRARLEDEAEGLMAELRVWDEACNFTPYHPRTQYGNIAHRHAMTIRLLRYVFGVDRDDPRVYRAALAILELAVEMVVQYRTMVWLTWPVVIAAFQLPNDDENRTVVMNLLENPGPHSCFDMRAAKRVVQAYWEFHDDGNQPPGAWEMSRAGQRPFFD